MPLEPRLPSEMTQLRNGYADLLSYIMCGGSHWSLTIWESLYTSSVALFICFFSFPYQRYSFYENSFPESLFYDLGLLYLPANFGLIFMWY